MSEVNIDTLCSCKWRKMSFCLWIALVALLWALPVRLMAQAKNVTVSVYRIEDPNKRSQRKPWNSQIVYGFFSAGKANRFFDNCNKAKAQGMSYVPQREDEYDALVETDADGVATLLLPLTGYVVVKPEGAEVRREAIKGRLNFDINIVEGKVMKTTFVVAKRPKGPEPQIPNSCGNRLEFTYQFPLSAEQVDVKSRILIKPLVTVLETGDTLGYLAPFVMDGKEFSKANLRRMSFDLTRDPLYPYRVGVMRKSHKADSMPLHFVLYPIDKKFHYKVTADMVFGMNMKTPYRTDSVCLAEGYVRDPMRFLDYDMIQVPLDRDLYKRSGRAQLNRDHARLNLNFLVGKAELDPSDSSNVVQMEQLKQNLSRYMGADAGITGAVIHGSASPEGGIAINERLCRQRADYLRTELIRFPALQEARQSGEVKTTAKVATWEDVAKQLEADSLVEEARMVRSVLQYLRDSRRQEEKIRQLPCWELIEKRILPRFRYVDIEYSYYTNRVKTPEEIWKQYKEEPDYHAGKRQQPYEFYELLKMLKDPVEKEPIARAAYLGVKDEDGERAWPLAAYELAQCYLSRDHVDTLLLKPYLDTEVRSFHRKRDFDRDAVNGWYNDPAIVTAHINMLCKVGDFAKAYTYAFKLLPKEPKYKKLEMFLRCLNCEWDVQEVMDTVSRSSYWNNIVVLAAQTDVSNRETALYMLNNAGKVDQADPKALYMKAQLLFNLYGKQQKSTMGYKDENFVRDEYFEPLSDDPYHDNYGETIQGWGLPMAQCCAIDSQYIDIMLFDGDFNEDYRKAFKAYWKKVKEGKLPPPVIPEHTAQAGQRVEEESDVDFLDEAFGIE